MISRRGVKRGTRGATIVEFAFIAFLLVWVLLAGIEFDRMVLVYTTLANSARVGMRYAIVHGSSRPSGSGVDDASGPGANPSQVVDVIKDFAGVGLLNKTALTISVTYPDGAISRPGCSGGNNPGCLVNVSVTYPYDPFTVLPVGINLSSQSTGIIAF